MTTQRDRTYSLAGVIKAGIEARLSDLHTGFPARVVRYDETLRQCDVLPLVQRIWYDETGARQTDTPPVITNVPVLFPSGGGFVIAWPLTADDQKGDVVWVMCAEVSLDIWLGNGGNDIDPEDERRFHLSDAVALPGLFDFGHVTGVSKDKMVVGGKGGIAIYLDDQKVRIGDSDDTKLDAAALGGQVATALANIKTFLTTHTHPVSGATAGASTNPPPTIPEVKSATVFVKT